MGAAYLGGGRGRGGGLRDLDVLHLDGMLCVGLRVVELGDVHRGLLGLVRGSGLREEKPRPTLTKVKGKPAREKV